MQTYGNKIKRALTNGILLLGSLAVAVLFCEAGTRLFLNPANYLSVSPVRDDILGIRIAPGSGGFDEWGFRNKSVPATADIVAIGDSHTYGNNATMDESWPYVAGRLTGRTVYNLGLGGYGPNQYYHLLQTRALKLKPRLILCGLYFGDDFENTFLMTYGRDYWLFLRQGEWGKQDANIWETPAAPSRSQRMRNWLSEHSIVYRLVVHGPLLGALKGALQIRKAEREQDPRVAPLMIPEAHILEAFRPLEIQKNLDQSSGPVREGMRITLELLGRMNQASRENGVQFAVVLIPTKETVFADYFAGKGHPHLRNEIQSVIANEQEARNRVVEFLGKEGIPYVDALPALRREVSNQLYTRSDRDMHPSGNGYRVIGQAVAEFLKSNPGADKAAVPPR